jgi:hypothetical protein
VFSNSFDQQDNLKIYQRLDSVVQPFNCDVCNKSFSQFDLKIRQHIHNGIIHFSVMRVISYSAKRAV